MTKDDLSSVIKQVDEDRKRNSEQHQKLFDSVNVHAKEISELSTMLKSFRESLEEMKREIRDGLKDIHNEIRELRK